MIHYYRDLAQDAARLEAFDQAIRRTVKPGDVVADVGCGLGIFSVFACRAGASRVYAIDAGPVLEVAREVVAHNGCADRVRFLSGFSHDLPVPERVNVALFEDYKVGLLTPMIVHFARDIAQRWLAPGGCLVPGRARVWVAPVSDPAGRRALDFLSATGEHVCGVDLRTARSKAFSSPISRVLAPETLVAPPVLVAELDLLRLDAVRLGFDGGAVATRSAPVHGLLSWFELDLGGVWFSTGPEVPRCAWRQTFLPLEQVIDVRQGAPLDLSLHASPSPPVLGDGVIWRWGLGADGVRVDVSSFEAMPLSAGRLQLARDGFVPRPSRMLRADARVFDLIDGKRTMAEIAREMYVRLPEIYPDQATARFRLEALLGGYSSMIDDAPGG